jgi:hypothetical protein
MLSMTLGACPHWTPWSKHFSTSLGVVTKRLEAHHFLCWSQCQFSNFPKQLVIASDWQHLAFQCQFQGQRPVWCPATRLQHGESSFWSSKCVQVGFILLLQPSHNKAHVQHVRKYPCAKGSKINLSLAHWKRGMIGSGPSEPSYIRLWSEHLICSCWLVSFSVPPSLGKYQPQ